jgi:SAM-dependent methyltransferase
VAEGAGERAAGGGDAWATLGERFVDVHYGSLRGQVRTYVIDQHLRGHLAPPPLGIADVGGGAGHQSLPLARAGYDVTIVDPSAAMLDRARALLSEEDDAVARRVRLVEAPGEDAPDVLGDERFGGVLCHGVLMYLDDPGPLVGALCALADRGGVVSVVAKNVDVMAVRPALEGDWATALAMFDSDRQVNGLGVDTRGDDVGALSAMLRDRGVEPIDWYGVRLFTDGWAPERPPTDPDDLVLRVELEASRRDPYRRMSRLFHLVGRRG